MVEETRFSDRTWDALMDETRSGFQGPFFEAARRLVVATQEQTRAAENQSRAGTFFAWAFVALAVVQIGVAVYDAVAP